MILIIKTDDESGNWQMVEGESVAERGSIVEIKHKDKLVGYGEVIGFKRDNRANQSIHRFAIVSP